MSSADYPATATPYTVEHRISIAGITVETRDYTYDSPYRGRIDRDINTLSLTLSPRNAYSQCAYLLDAGACSRWVDVGDTIFAPAGVSQLCRGAGGAQRRVCCHYTAPALERLAGLGGGWQEAALLAGLDVQSKPIKRGLLQLAQEVAEPGLRSAQLVEALGGVLAVELARYLQRAVSPAPVQGSGLAGWQLRRITDYVQSFVDPAPTVGRLAELCEISPRHFRRAFKQSTGQTVSAFLDDARMLKAQNLLVETGLSLKEIAYRLGYSSPSSFSVAFSRAQGTTPKQFRTDNAASSRA